MRFSIELSFGSGKKKIETANDAATQAAAESGKITAQLATIEQTLTALSTAVDTLTTLLERLAKPAK